MEKLFVVKIGGHVIDDESKLDSFLQSFANIDGRKVLIHGGGKLATRVAEAMAVPQEMIDGRRITNAETLKVITMVYAGYINKNIVAKLQSMQCNAIGLTGADANLIAAHKRIHPTIDYGFVGDIDAVNGSFIKNLLEQNISIVVAPVTHDEKGSLLNTNADTIAQEIAKAMCSDYDVSLIYCFEKDGLLTDAKDDQTVISDINTAKFNELKAQGIISAGMIPKMDNAFAALNGGVQSVRIGNAEKLGELVEGRGGTRVGNRQS